MLIIAWWVLVFLMIYSFLYVINEQVMVAYSKDPSPVKLNLGIGVYRTEVNLVYCKLVSADKFVKVMNCVGVPFASIVV